MTIRPMLTRRAAMALLAGSAATPILSQALLTGRVLAQGVSSRAV